MRIAFLTHEPFYPPSGGGSAEALYLVEEMVRRKHTVHLFCPAFPDAQKIAGEYGVELHAFTRWTMGRYASFRNVKYLMYPAQLERLVLEAVEAGATFDLLVSQHAISAVAAGRLRGSLRIPVVMNFLDYLTGFMETWPVWLAPPVLLRRLKRFEISLPSRYEVDGVMTVSQPLADTFADAGYPITRLHPIYYGYDAERFPLRRSGPSGEHPVVIMHGSFDQHHLGSIALEAMKRIHSDRPDVVFKFVGELTSGLKRFVNALRSAAPGIKIECTGFISYEKVADELSGASVGIVPYEESSGTHCAFVAKAVEYLGVGLPVVSTRLDNLAQYFDGERRIRFSDFTGGDLAVQVLAWLKDPELREVNASATAAADRVRSELDWRVISRSAVDFLEKTRDEFR